MGKKRSPTRRPIPAAQAQEPQSRNLGGKALRILLNYCIQEADKDKIFTEIRCRNC